MLHAALRPGQSRRRLVSHLICAASLLAAMPAFAKKKVVEESPAAATESTESASTGDPKLVPPPPDTFGRVHFGPSSAPDLGRVSVKAPASDDVKVFLEGRFFGTAPITIYSVPKGDYIIEGTYPDGKTVSKAVSVLENDEAVADLTGAHAALVQTSNKKGGGMFSGKEISEQRQFAMKAFAIGGAAALVLGVTFGVLEMRKESDYRNSTGTQADLDNIASTGKTYALLANVGYALAFVGVVGAAVCAYPLFVKPEKKTVALAPRPVFVVVPASAGSGATGAMSLRF